MQPLAILAVSIATCKLAAIEANVSLFKHLGNSKSNQLPIPLLNIINGGCLLYTSDAADE